MKNKTAIIIGAGPAGLTAAYELIKIGIKPIILESGSQVGGLSKTLDRNGWKFDIGPHRFFTKAKEVADLWTEILPIAPEKMLIKNRLTRIYYQQKLFSYPVELSFQTLKTLGFLKSLKIGLSYIKAFIKPIKNEKSLEDFFINRFGQELYKTFFDSYTEKVWGVPCNQIPKDWGAQRVKGLSLLKVIANSLQKIFKVKNINTETSLIDTFLYPRLGAGQMYEALAQKIIAQGGEIIFNTTAESFKNSQTSMQAVIARQNNSGKKSSFTADYFFSTQPLKELFSGLENTPGSLQEIANGLPYRHIIVVALVYKKLSIKTANHKTSNLNIVPDNWIYIQEDGVNMGRLSIFNNFSEAMLKEKDKVWLGAEYFCDLNDKLWQAQEPEIIKLAQEELAKMKIANRPDFVTAFVHKQSNAYPSYFGTYQELPKLKDYLNNFTNLFLIGRNGQHRYNNMDHSMLTAIRAVRNIKNDLTAKDNIWNVNTEEDYHETKSS